MKRVIDSAAPLWKDDINYPGVPPMPDRPLAAKVTNRATVDYDTYVLAYTTRKVLYVMLAALGAAGAVLAVAATTGAAMVILAALSIGAALSGVVGVMVITDAHHTYTRHLAVAVTETYHDRPAAPPSPPPPTARPIVASANGNPHTTRTGRLQFEPTVWRDLFDRALRNGGAVTRDGALSARVGREWYHGEGWGHLQEELTHLGFIDHRNRLTAKALDWYEKEIPLPLSVLPLRTGVERTNDRSERTNDAEGGEWEAQ